MTELAAIPEPTERRPMLGVYELEEPYGPNPLRSHAVEPLSMPRPERDVWIRKQILAGIEKRIGKGRRIDPAVQIANLRRILALKARGPI